MFLPLILSTNRKKEVFLPHENWWENGMATAYMDRQIVSTQVTSSPYQLIIIIIPLYIPAKKGRECTEWEVQFPGRREAANIPSCTHAAVRPDRAVPDMSLPFIPPQS
jgi:hypothetical protein